MFRRPLIWCILWGVVPRLPVPGTGKRRFGRGGVVEALALTMREACAALKVSRWTMAELVADGKIKAARLGGKYYRFHRTELERFLLNGPPLEPEPEPATKKASKRKVAVRAAKV